MGIEVADRAVHFGQQGHLRDTRHAGLQAHQHIRHFLADRGRAGRLSVGATEHGLVCIRMRHVTQFVGHGLQAGQQNLRACRFELQCMAGVVDVFAGASEMNEFKGCSEFVFQCIRQRGALALGFKPVLNRFDIVVGGFFNLFDGQGIVCRKLLDQVSQKHARRR